MYGPRSIALLVSRVILGIIFISHGVQKLNNGIDATTAFFDSVGVPAPTFSAYFATWVELIGGILLILGVALPLVATLLIIDMIGAIATVHWDAGFWNSDGGYEFPLALIAGLVAVGFVTAGGFAVDGHIARLRGGSRVGS
ncbi:DoxX family protein [Gordonia desulfuricans]|uniref:DoxX family protein n=1 Tax=Gordonia desulfuricans TaxID=89051 RepID=A0A7K3LVH1_9ACTN|nr:DoxX family protein [Gordonia desulfuricans]NDK92244.1 DoxX family protein [Gordonia desulfuricans]